MQFEISTAVDLCANAIFNYNSLLIKENFADVWKVPSASSRPCFIFRQSVV